MDTLSSSSFAQTVELVKKPDNLLKDEAISLANKIAATHWRKLTGKRDYTPAYAIAKQITDIGVYNVAMSIIGSVERGL